MENPFDLILQQLQEIKGELSTLKSADAGTQPEIISRAELQKRLGISEPTAVLWGRKGKIPELRVGASIRYNWPSVIAALENDSKPKKNRHAGN
jgi:hypothetical protein